MPLPAPRDQRCLIVRGQPDLPGEEHIPRLPFHRDRKGREMVMSSSAKVPAHLPDFIGRGLTPQTVPTRGGTLLGPPSHFPCGLVRMRRR